MSHAEADDAKHHEIVIVRHGHGDHDDGHHGGAWKIAFADFMTAMMCFFLVMWLINASNEQTKASVASYFNPVKLIDRNASRKGIEEVGDGPQETGEKQEKAEKKSAGEATAGKSTNEGTSETKSESTVADEKLFADPYAVLAEIAADTGKQQNISTEGAGGAQAAGPATGASGGEAYRDPFAPDFWSQQVQTTPSEAEASAEIPKPEVQNATSEEMAAMAPADDPFSKPEPADSKPEAALAESVKPEPVVAEPVAAEPAAAKPAEPVKPAGPPQPSAATIKAADQIRQELAKALLPGDRLKDGISVIATDKGVQVSVTDQFDFGMFEIGSAVPRRELILAMEKISKAISAQKGTVTISGHTDARPFKKGSYDNWRLSTSRAHSAYYMLVRGGLDQERITEVAGFADRKLKDRDNPLSAANRRIEILLEIPQ